MRRLGTALVGLTLVASVVAAVVLTQQPGTPATSAAPSAVVRQSPSPSPTPAIAPGLVRFGGVGAPSPSVHAAQSQLWYHADAWWATLLNGETGAFHIYRLEPDGATWTDSGVVVDTRGFARLDVLWDGRSLVIVSAGRGTDPRHALQVNRFSFDDAGERYVRDANFPLSITDGGVDTPTVARDAAGRLWVAYRIGAQLYVDHTTDSDLAWTGPTVPGVAEGAVEQAAIASVGASVAVVFTRPDDDLVFVGIHPVDAAGDVWEELTPALVPSISLGEEELSLAVDNSPGAERLYVALATGASGSESRGRLDPQVVLVEFGRSPDPGVFLVGRLAEQHVDPIVVLDGASRRLYVVAAAPRSGGSIYYKTSPLDDIAFAPGLGSVLVPAEATNPELANPSSTKQALDARSGLVVAASDSSTGVYAFGSIGLEPATGRPDPSPVEPDTEILLEQTFDGLPVGAAVPGWSVEGDPLPPYTITVIQGIDSSARLSSTATDGRACATFDAGPAARLLIEGTWLYNLATGDDLRVLQVRGAGGERASVRLRGDELVYFDGATRVRSDVFVQPGRWYRSTLSLDLTGGSYDLTVIAVASNEVILDVDGLGARVTDPGAVPNRVCAEIPPQPGLDLYIDDVRVVASTE